jgi:hypothetical protein
MRAYKGVDVKIHIFLTSALAGGEWSALVSGRLNPRERAPGMHFIGDWVDPKAGLDDVGKRKFLRHQDSNSNPLIIQPVPSRYTDYAIPAHVSCYIEYLYMSKDDRKTYRKY